MSDIQLSLIVIAGCAVLVALIFILARRRNETQNEALVDYCATRGYSLARESAPLEKKLTVSSDDWRLIANKQAIMNESSSGSSGWRKETVWIGGRENALRPVFAVHCSTSISEWEKLPEWVRAAATQKIRDCMDDAPEGLLHARVISSSAGRAYLVFEQEAQSAQAALEKLMLALDDWDMKLPLYVVSSPQEVKLRMMDNYIERSGEIDMVIRIGLAAQ